MRKKIKGLLQFFVLVQVQFDPFETAILLILRHYQERACTQTTRPVLCGERLLNLRLPLGMSKGDFKWGWMGEEKMQAYLQYFH